MDYGDALCTLTALQDHKDERGNLVEIVALSIGEEKIAQVNVLWINKGKSRGGHYHKKNGEWFCVLSGSVKFKLRKVDEYGALMGGFSNVFDGGAPTLIWIPPFTVHTLENCAEDTGIVLVAAPVPFVESKDDVFWVNND